jgi:hypothetical protein
MPTREIPEGQQDSAHAYIPGQHSQQPKRWLFHDSKLTENAICTAALEDKKVIFIIVKFEEELL